jgi:peptidoglycan hydrolase-like protein with peptidoglycan-binding domain
MRKYLIVATAALAAMVGAVASPTVAHATHAEGFISGFDDPTNDWADEGTMSSASHRQSIATGLWQAVLYADGYLSQSGVDCDFGPNTTAATRAWQSAHSVGVDGSVGPQTLGRADNKLWIYSNENGIATIIYDGIARDITFIRRSPSDSSFPGGYRVPYVEDSWQYTAQYHFYIGDC